MKFCGDPSHKFENELESERVGLRYCWQDASARGQKSDFDEGYIRQLESAAEKLEFIFVEQEVCLDSCCHIYDI